MRVAFDITETCGREPTGCGHFAQHVVQAMLDENHAQGWGDAYTLHYRASHRNQACHGFRPPGYVPRPLSRLGSFRAKTADIIHGFATHSPGLGKALRVVTLLDVFSALEQSARWQHPRSRRRKMGQYRRLARSCDLIIAISETTRRDFLSHFDYPEDRVHVVHGGVGPAFSSAARSQGAAIRAHYGLPESYFLYVGAPVPRKNVPRLIDAYAASASRRQTSLVIAGTINGEAERLIEKAERMGLGRDVHFVGYVSDADLPALYASAEAFLFPTFYEGFGLPILEAMACGVPVLIGNRGAAPEIAGGHALAVDPDDTHALSEAIDRVTEKGDEDRGQSAAFAARFTWTRCAVKNREAYQWVLNSTRERV